MANAIMTIQKIKSFGTLVSKQKHNLRQVEVTNAAAELKDMNTTLVPLPEENGETMGYDEAVKQRIMSQPYYKTHNVKSNQVLAYEVVLTFSREDENGNPVNIDVDEWEKRNIQWLKDTFNVSPDGGNNVIHAICHKDEPGNVHIHAIVVPIDERGRLNARAFTGGSVSMSTLQSDYASSVEDLGLERGLSGSSAKHHDIRRFYADLNNAISSVPAPEEHETAEEYGKRVIDTFEEIYAANLKRIYDRDKKLRKLRDEEMLEAKKSIEADMKIYHAEMQRLDDAMKKLAEVSERYEKIENSGEKAKKMELIEAGIEAIREENPSQAQYIEGQLQILIDRALIDRHMSPEIPLDEIWNDESGREDI